MIAVIEGCGTNLASIVFALERLGQNVQVTSNAQHLQAASHVIIPGVSTAQRAMAQLKQQNLVETLRSLTQPVLGICSGMQILFDWCEEGAVNGLGIFTGKVIKLSANVLPHMGWNTLQLQTDCRLFAHISDNSYVYFVHSYGTEVNAQTIASCNYGNHFSAMVAKENYYGFQFHPERSGKVGLQLLRNFIEL